MKVEGLVAKNELLEKECMNIEAEIYGDPKKRHKAD
jgi:hypothetical protein